MAAAHLTILRRYTEMLALLLPLLLQQYAAAEYTIPSLANDNAAPAVCIYGSGTLRVNVLVAIWEDGRTIWSDDSVDGGPPYRETVQSSEEMASAITEIVQGGLLSPSEGPCPRSETVAETWTTTVDFVVDGVLRSVSTEQFRAEAGGIFVYTSQGVVRRGDRTLEQILAAEPGCFLEYRSRVDQLRSSVYALLPEDPTSYPQAPLVFEMRKSTELASALKPTPVAPPSGMAWAPQSAAPTLRLSSSLRADEPLIWLATTGSLLPSPRGVEAVYSDGTVIWPVDPKLGTSYSQASVDPASIEALTSQWQSSSSVFSADSVSFLRAADTKAYAVLSLPVAGSRREVRASHEFCEQWVEGCYYGPLGPSSPLGSGFEGWMAQQPARYRQFRSDWKSVHDALRALRPTDPAQSTPLGEVTWTLTPITAPTPSPTP